MFFGRLASPAIATKCEQDSLDAYEVQVELGGRLSPVTKRENRFVQGEQRNVNWKWLQPTTRDLRPSRSKFVIDGEWKAPSCSAELDLISPNTEELFRRVPQAYPELQSQPRKKTLPHNGLMKGPFV
jgi:hypothetical protein